MQEWGSEWHSDMQRLLAGLRAAEPRELRILQDIWEYLRISELMLLDTLNGRPENPDYAGRGNAEFGHFLYHLHNPHPKLTELVELDEVARAVWNLAAHASKPSSTIAPEYLANLHASVTDWPMVDQEGAILAFEQYEALDPLWCLAFINLVISLFHQRHDFGSSPCVQALVPKSGDRLRLGIVGDWGAGAYGPDGGPAVAVMKQLNKMDCDYLVHLGDTYYVGTGNAPYLPAKEEENNFVNQWPQNIGKGRSFTLNSNHEMYAGGCGYFSAALGSDMFRHQNMTSYFALTFGKWVILGLDTAYNASLEHLYMVGALGEQQSAWIREYRDSIGGFDGKKILVLTHHEGQDFQGDAPTSLFGEVTQAIGRAPDVWYWGHLHNNIAYSDGSAAGKLGARTRCVGHSAIPRGLASGLVDSKQKLLPSVEFLARTPSKEEGRKRVLAGFATLELGANGDITELFFDLGNTAPIWRSINGVRSV